MYPRLKGTIGEILPDTREEGWLTIEHVLQGFREVWVPISTWPYLAVDVAKVESLRQRAGEVVVFANGRLMQNIRPDEGGMRLLNGFMGGGVDAGMSPDAQVIVEGVANPKAHWMMYFNDPFMIGMHPFAALGTQYIYVDEAGIYQRTFAETVVVDGYSRPRSEFVDFDTLADLVNFYHLEYINSAREVVRDTEALAALLDAIFVENEKIHSAARRHHRERVSSEVPFDYAAPTLTRYGRLTHDASGQPRIELSFALLHYEKALREFQYLKVSKADGGTEGALLHGVYCVVAVAACIEAIGNRLVHQQTGQHPDHRDRRTPLRKINEAGAALAQTAGGTFVPLVAGQTTYDLLERVRELRNAFMHAKERDEEIDPVALTSVVFTAVDEDRCREFLRNLRLAMALVYDQLAPKYGPPIVIRDNVKWLGDLEVP